MTGTPTTPPAVQPQILPTASATPSPEATPAEATPPASAEPEFQLIDEMLEQMDAPQDDDIFGQEDPPATVQPGQTPSVPSSSEPTAPAVAPAAVVPPVQPAVQATPQQPAAPQAPAAAPAQVPQQPVVPQAQQPATTPSAPQAPVPGNELEQLRAGLEAQRENFVKTAAQSYLPTFSDSDVEALQSGEPAATKQVLATMAARLHADIAQNILGMVASQMPGMISRAQMVQSQHQQAEDAFYQEYPDLRAHGATVKQIAGALRAQNPNMPAEQFKPMLVAMARVATGSAAQAASSPVPPQQQVPAAPIRQAPFVPAASGRGAAAPQRGAKLDQWGFLSEIVEAEERGAFER